MLLIAADPADPTSGLVLPRLRAAGVEVMFWNESAFPAEDRVTLTFEGSVPAWRLRAGGRTHDLGRVTTVWDRRPDYPSVAPEVAASGQADYSLRVSRQLLDGLWDTLPATWFPAPPCRGMYASNKVLQLARAVELGFTVPDTWFTNDPAALVPAWTAAGGRLITKGFNARNLMRDGQKRLWYTSRVTRRHLARRHRLAYAPAILQPDVPKALEVRVTVVGTQAFSAGIDSQASRFTAQDFRLSPKTTIAFAPHDLPDTVATACVDLVASFGLAQGAIDLILTPAGDYVFLELNPHGEWGWQQGEAGLPISDAIADWLIASETERSSIRDAQPDHPHPAAADVRPRP